MYMNYDDDIYKQKYLKYKKKYLDLKYEQEGGRNEEVFFSKGKEGKLGKLGKLKIQEDKVKELLRKIVKAVNDKDNISEPLDFNIERKTSKKKIKKHYSIIKNGFTNNKNINDEEEWIDNTLIKIKEQNDKIETKDEIIIKILNKFLIDEKISTKDIIFRYFPEIEKEKDKAIDNQKNIVTDIKKKIAQSAKAEEEAVKCDNFSYYVDNKKECDSYLSPEKKNEFQNKEKEQAKVKCGNFEKVGEFYYDFQQGDKYNNKCNFVSKIQKTKDYQTEQCGDMSLKFVNNQKVQIIENEDPDFKKYSKNNGTIKQTFDRGKCVVLLQDNEGIPIEVKEIPVKLIKVTT